MWPFVRDKLAVSRPEDCLPGRNQPMPVPERHFVNGHPLAGPYPEGHAEGGLRARLLLGRGADVLAGAGVWVTAVGYAGGSTPNPTYEEVCSGRTGHTEVVLVVYDPKVTSYEELLKTVLGEP